MKKNILIHAIVAGLFLPVVAQAASPIGNITKEWTYSHSATPVSGLLAEIAAYDAWILLDSASQLDTWESSGFGLGVIATVEVQAPEGGFQTVTLTLTAAVP